jgi:hypothetical protein
MTETRRNPTVMVDRAGLKHFSFFAHLAWLTIPKNNGTAPEHPVNLANLKSNRSSILRGGL